MLGYGLAGTVLVVLLIVFLVRGGLWTQLWALRRAHIRSSVKFFLKGVDANPQPLRDAPNAQSFSL